MAVCPTCGRDAGSAKFCVFDGTPLAHVGRGPASLPMIGDTIDDRYELLEELGRGGMAIVFLARSHALDSEVALKVLYPRWAEDRKTIARFAREARAASQIDHESVVRVYDFGYAQQGYYFLAMERLSGEPLQDLLAGGRVEPLRALRILRAIADGVARAHELGVIHRDLKPENVMLRTEDGKDFVTIVDFGLSKIQEGDAMLTGEGDVIGTPDFMAPEQWQGKHVDARADVYSFGVMAYELLSGELPFKGDTLIQKLQQHLNASPTPLADLPSAPALPAGLSELIHECLRKAPDARPESMGVVAAELLRIEDAYEAEWKDPTGRLAAGPAPMATVMAPTQGAGMGKLALLTEIRRLTRVRQQRLLELLPRMFRTLPPPIEAHEKRIRDAETLLENAEQRLAIAEATLKEAQRAHRSKEAELRARLVAANLELAVARNALPGDVTQSGLQEVADTISFGAETTEPSIEDGDEAQRARVALQSAERRLGEFVKATDPAVVGAEGEFDLSLARVRDVESPIEALYEELEAAVRASPGVDTGALSELAELDGVLTTYNVRLELIVRRDERNSRRAGDG